MKIFNPDPKIINAGRTTPRIWVDLDGVMANFDLGYEKLFGHKPDKDNEPKHFWQIINDQETFFYDLELMPDAMVLWDHIKHLDPWMLTGAPMNVPNSPWQKKHWIKDKVGEHVNSVTCQSKLKYTYCLPGDIMIDDWNKYKHLWVKANGIWIDHYSAAETIKKLNEINLSKHFNLDKTPYYNWT